jgi:Flp pilus assembly protein TadD
MTIDDTLKQADEQFRARRFQELLQTCQKILQIEPNNPDALSLMSIAARELGKIDEAVLWATRACAAYPHVAPFHANLGQFLRLRGDLDQSLLEFRRAIELDPNEPTFHNSLGVVYADLRDHELAIRQYRVAIDLRRDYVDALNNLGKSHESQGRIDDAAVAYLNATKASPGSAAAYSNLGNLLLGQRRVDEAIALLRKAVGLAPEMPEAHCNLGNALSSRGCFDDAMTEYRTALRLRPRYPAALSNIAGTLIERGMFDESENLLRQAIEIDPNFADAHWNLALLLLLKGDFRRGLPEYEWRLTQPAMSASLKIPQPRWDGGEIAAKTILVYAEQGHGDAIQFVRYATLLAQRGAKVIVKCFPELRRLFATVEGIEQVLAAKDPVPPFDLHCPMVSLPLAFKTDLNSIPASAAPYLHPNPADAEKWRQRLVKEDRRRIGLVWAGDPRHRRDATRSIPPSSFSPLTEATDAAFYSLQKGEGTKPPTAHDLEMIDFTPEFHDFAETAAFIANLDLVIAVDTSVAHLAGALGKPVWLLLPYSPDWRWLLDRDDSPWYPTMRLFRQKIYGDWTEVIRRVTDELKAGAR